MSSLALAVTVAGPQQPVFQSAVDLVQVDISVTWKNRPVADLTAADFAISDNGVPQTILDVSRETMPIDLTLILDGSSTGGALIRNSTVAGSLGQAVNRIRESLRPGDRVSLVTFNRRVEERFHLRPTEALGPVELFSNGPLLVAPGETALYDALVLSLPRSATPDRRQLAILCSSGPDTMSFNDEAAAFDVARRSAAAIFVVGSTVDPNPLPGGSFEEPPAIGDQSGRPSVPFQAPARPPTSVIFGSRALPMKFLQKLVDETGGEMQVIEPVVYLTNNPYHFEIRPQVTKSSIAEFFLRALDSFRAGYVVRYAAQGVPRTGWHSLTVGVTRQGAAYEVKARRGYAGG
jgi:VWFA-related protein